MDVTQHPLYTLLEQYTQAHSQSYVQGRHIHTCSLIKCLWEVDSCVQGSHVKTEVESKHILVFPHWHVYSIWACRHVWACALKVYILLSCLMLPRKQLLVRLLSKKKKKPHVHTHTLSQSYLWDLKTGSATCQNNTSPVITLLQWQTCCPAVHNYTRLATTFVCRSVLSKLIISEYWNILIIRPYYIFDFDVHSGCFFHLCVHSDLLARWW